jgi:hypothetical protein
MTPKEAMAHRGWLAVLSLTKEVKQLDDKDTIKPVQMHAMSKVEIENILPSFTFVEDKYGATTSEYVKTNSRLVGGGDRQNRLLSDDTWSPCVATSALYIGAGIAAAEGRKVAVIDIPAAYINAEFPEDHEKVFMRLGEIESAILVQLRPEYLPYLRQDGSMIVQITRALYGLIESAKMWFEEISATLKSIGFLRLHEIKFQNH